MLKSSLPHQVKNDKWPCMLYLMFVPKFNQLGAYFLELLQKKASPDFSNPENL